MKLIKLKCPKNNNYYTIQIDYKRRTFIREHLHRCLNLDLNNYDYITKLPISTQLSIVWELKFENVNDLLELIPEEFL